MCWPSVLVHLDSRGFIWGAFPDITPILFPSLSWTGTGSLWESVWRCWSGRRWGDGDDRLFLLFVLSWWGRASLPLGRGEGVELPHSLPLGRGGGDDLRLWFYVSLPPGLGEGYEVLRLPVFSRRFCIWSSMCSTSILWVAKRSSIFGCVYYETKMKIIIVDIFYK